MDFSQHQNKAKGKTFQLGCLYVVGLFVLTIVTCIAAVIITGGGADGGMLLLLCLVGVPVLVIGGSLFTQTVKDTFFATENTEIHGFFLNEREDSCKKLFSHFFLLVPCLSVPSVAAPPLSPENNSDYPSVPLIRTKIG